MGKTKDLSHTYGKEPQHAMDLDTESYNLDDIIQLTQEDLHRLHLPWSNSIIIKVFGKRLPYMHLKNKLQHLWRTTKPITLIDLGHD